jgi:hypothetical protein
MIDAMKRALEALEWRFSNADAAIEALRQAIEQAEKQEPVAWISDSPTKGNGKQLHFTKTDAWRWSSNITPLYTAPPKREWVGLLDEEIEQAVGSPLDEVYLSDFRRVIEKLRSKNT